MQIPAAGSKNIDDKKIRYNVLTGAGDSHRDVSLLVSVMRENGEG